MRARRRGSRQLILCLVRGPVRVVLLSLFVLSQTVRASDDAAKPPRFWPQKRLAAAYIFTIDALRPPKTFFICPPDGASCHSVHMIGWEKPFIITRDEGAAPGWNVYNTYSRKYKWISETDGLPDNLRQIALVPADVAWEKLSPITPLWR